MVNKKTAAGLAFVAAALAVAAVNDRLFPHGLNYVLFVFFLWAGGTLVARGLGWTWKKHGLEELEDRRIRPLRPGESYDRPVRLATMPNVPLAEVWRQRLHQNGIESFYKGASPFGAS